MQETLLRALRCTPEAIAERPARPWLFAVARNLAVDSHRARNARPREVGEAALELVPVADEADRVLESWAVADALRDLRPEHRQVLVQTYYLGRSVAEAATELGIPGGTVKSRTFYALKALKLALEERGSRHELAQRTAATSARARCTCSGPSIPPSARRGVHLSTCPECREELAGLVVAVRSAGSRSGWPELADDDQDELSDAPAAVCPPRRCWCSLLLPHRREARQTRRWRGLAAAVAGGPRGRESGQRGGACMRTTPRDADDSAVAAPGSPRHRDQPGHRCGRDVPPVRGQGLGHGAGDAGGQRRRGGPVPARRHDSSGRTMVVGGWTTSYDEQRRLVPRPGSGRADSVRSFEIMSQGKVLVTVRAH